MKEKDIQNKILKYLNDNDIGFFFKFHNGPYGSRGVSDIVGVFEGLAVFMEVKVPGGRLTKLQEKFLRDAENNGAIASVVHDLDEAKGTIARARIVSRALNKT